MAAPVRGGSEETAGRTGIKVVQSRYRELEQAAARILSSVG